MNRNETIFVESYFDGTRIHRDGPYSIVVKNGIIAIAGHAESTPDDANGICRARFAMPSMVESHCHLFLDGDELDPAKRSAYLKGTRESMLETAFANVERYRGIGIRVIRDAGDIHGINHEVRDRVANSGMTVLSAGIGIRRRKRYGAFMAREIEHPSEIGPLVSECTRSADAIKIVLTGIIDFENGVVKDPPQFSVEEVREIVAVAHGSGLKTFAHCSGIEGLEIAVRGGVDSIEHGFFMTPSILDEMAEHRIAWCPTCIPVHFQWEKPEFAGWNQPTVSRLREILDNHEECLRYADRIGIEILAGSDGGSYGVQHGGGLLRELELLRKAGLSQDAVLKAVTSAPKRHFCLSGGKIVPGESADITLLDSSPCAEKNQSAPHFRTTSGSFSVSI
jgi:imidazolonepropionase-like amidohydrolase